MLRIKFAAEEQRWLDREIVKLTHSKREEGKKEEGKEGGRKEEGKKGRKEKFKKESS